MVTTELPWCKHLFRPSNSAYPDIFPHFLVSAQKNLPKDGPPSQRPREHVSAKVPDTVSPVAFGCWMENPSVSEDFPSAHDKRLPHAIDPIGAQQGGGPSAEVLDDLSLVSIPHLDNFTNVHGLDHFVLTVYFHQASGAVQL
jgi:hypothetical protein